MFVSGNSSISGQGSSQLNFLAVVGDKVRFHGTSESDNFEKIVQVYDIKRFDGEQVFSPF
ncbi:hypothetical protein J8M00_03730 [Pseudoalteromonas luteoviolacea]|nr:hypothetical protein [Pseudoalteromonas luteoviolacea]